MKCCHLFIIVIIVIIVKHISYLLSAYSSFSSSSSSHQGDIYILSPLDRETKDHYTLTAVARDNPGGITNNRRENSVQVCVIVCC